MGAIGIVLAGGGVEKLGELAAHRAIAAMPVGGNYRSIDFSLSNMSNSGIKKIGVITQYNSRSLRDHLNSSKWWDLGRKNGGLYVFTPYLTQNNPYWYRGTADAMYQNLTFLRKSTEEYVVIASGDHVYNIDFTEVIAYHAEKNADITVVYKRMPEEHDVSSDGIMLFDDQQRMVDYEEKPLEPFSQDVFMGIYVMSRTLLMKILNEIVLEEKYDFVNAVIVGYRRKLKIYGYQYEGYWDVIKSIRSYYKINMDFLKEEVQKELFKPRRSIYTKIKDEAPAKYNNEAVVRNSMIPCGCIIDSNVENSVLFRGVRVGKNSIVKNCIIMEGTYIGNNCVLENVIIDKYVVISDGNEMIGTSSQPKIIAKETVI